MSDAKYFYAELSRPSKPMKEPNDYSNDLTAHSNNIENNERNQMFHPVPSILHINPINLLWCLLSLMISGMATFSFLQPFWLIEPRNPHYLGIYSYCVKDSNFIGQNRQMCGLYGGYFSIHNLPSLEWKITCVLFGSGCLLHIVCAIFGLSILCMWRNIRRRAACIIGFVQAIAVIFSVVGLLLFPMGFHGPFVRHYCSFKAQRFRPGTCEAGWGLLLACMGTALSIFCPILAQFFDVWVCEKPALYYQPNSLVSSSSSHPEHHSIYKIELMSSSFQAGCPEDGNYAEMYPAANVGKTNEDHSTTNEDDYNKSSLFTPNETDSTTTLINQKYHRMTNPKQLPPLPTTLQNPQIRQLNCQSPFLTPTGTFSSSTGFSLPSNE